MKAGKVPKLPSIFKEVSQPSTNDDSLKLCWERMHFTPQSRVCLLLLLHRSFSSFSERSRYSEIPKKCSLTSLQNGSTLFGGSRDEAINSDVNCGLSWRNNVSGWRRGWKCKRLLRVSSLHVITIHVNVGRTTKLVTVKTCLHLHSSQEHLDCCTSLGLKSLSAF